MSTRSRAVTCGNLRIRKSGKNRFSVLNGNRLINRYFRSVTPFRAVGRAESLALPRSGNGTLRLFPQKVKGAKNMNFFLAMNPPTATAQEKEVRVIKGKAVFFDPEQVIDAKQLLTGHLARHRPDKPLEGAISLRVIWLFPKGIKHKNGEWRITRPDTDNLQKLLKDCMTKCGFWKDDAQVCREIVEKRWSAEPAGIYIEIEELEVSG